MSNTSSSADSLLKAVYKNLHYEEGELLSAEVRPDELTPEQWIEKGEWLSLAHQVGAEKIFFVNNNPVIVFAKSEAGEAGTLRLFNKIWCMARPMLLFIAQTGELAVYNLARSPVRTIDEWHTRPLDVVKSVADVATELSAYRREQIESGRLFEDKRFETIDQRADQLLIHDLKTVRAGLMEAGLKEGKLKYAHSLIGRSIFIRYLEDREILSRDYFTRVAENNAEWLSLLDNPPSRLIVDSDTEKSLYIRVLSNRNFTYALFNKLAEDFNGDMFPSDSHEEKAVLQKHLNRLQDFLLGDAGPQQKLFFWAYKFDIVPVELISSIYEEFYHVERSKPDDKGTHYTPSALVDFILSEVLTPERLESNPRILDPACGSGIFLVEAFRRIVRFHVKKRKGERLNAKELRNILRTQIAGIEINEEAVRVAAFSLYLALLHYQEPRDIIKQIEQKMRLPHLKYQEEQAIDDFHYNNLLNANTFNVKLNSTDGMDRLPFMDETTYPSFIDKQVDIVVGNPPWGDTDESDTAIKWCNTRNFPVGDEELSQAFIWKSLDLLRDGGCAGLLVSTGVFFKHHSRSIEFRRRWLQHSRLLEVVNFAHVREIFFHAGIAPFASLVFEKAAKDTDVKGNVVRYWSAKNTAQAARLQAVVLSRSDLRLVKQDDLARDDRLWKIYWWGNTRDRALINWLELNTPLGKLSENEELRIVSGQGFKKKGTKIITVNGIRRTVPDLVPSDWLSQYPYFPTEYFNRYGPINSDKFSSVPEKVHRRGVREVYEGDRLLIKRGISQRSGTKGQIIARMESEAFCFRNSIHGIKLKKGKTWEYKILLAIFWSSLARYYYFLTSSAWGMWHYELHLEEIERMPIRFPEDKALRDRIVGIVDKLRSFNPKSHILKAKVQKRAQIDSRITALEKDLDEAIFDLYELSEPERDQVRDMCEIGIEFFYNDYNSEAVKPIYATSSDEARTLFSEGIAENDSRAEMQNYVQVFLDIWNQELTSSNSEYQWHNVRPSSDWPLIALVFSVKGKNESPQKVTNTEQQQWLTLLKKLENELLVPYNTKYVYIDGMVRAVTDSDIIIIKRNEKRLWTRSMAREDAEATMVQAMNLQEARQSLQPDLAL